LFNMSITKTINYSVISEDLSNSYTVLHVNTKPVTDTGIFYIIYMLILLNMSPMAKQLLAMYSHVCSRLYFLRSAIKG